MKLDHYPLPQIDDLLDRVTHAYYLSSIALVSGYHQVQIAPGDQAKMAFVLRFSLYKFTVLPFGLCNAPSTFQYPMYHVFSYIIDWYILVCLGNILVYSKTADNHEKHMKCFQDCVHISSRKNMQSVSLGMLRSIILVKQLGLVSSKQI